VFLPGCIPLFSIPLKLVILAPYFFFHPGPALGPDQWILLSISLMMGWAFASQLIAFFPPFGRRQSFHFRPKVFKDKAITCFFSL
jgi:hypothetical protein